MDNITQKLAHIQTHLNAPKDAYNDFAKYNYRSAESILKAVKPLLAETQTVLTIADSVEMHGNRVYIRATATLSDGANQIATTAYAREPESKKGADDSQITGAASSYARKYALCGLFAIDDNKDADATNNHQDHPKSINLDETIKALKQAGSLENLKSIFGYAWSNATEDQRQKIKPIYESQKADFLAQQQEQQ